jgi:glycosyltransferase involved in cell wall biosynthesis
LSTAELGVEGVAPTPAISVVLPAYNAAETIGRAVESVLAQSCAEFELIIVDDCSEDGTPDVIAHFSTIDRRIVSLRQVTRSGSNAARNRGIISARSDLVSFIDADDSFHANKLEWVLNFFASHGASDVLIDSFEVVDAVAKRKLRKINPDLENTSMIEAGIYRRTINKPTPAISARRAALLKAGLFDETLRRRQDMDLLLRLIRAKSNFATTSEVLWTKHWLPQSITAQTATFLQALMDICERHPDYLRSSVFRQGLALDFARHLGRLVWAGRSTAAARDFQRFSQIYGWSLAVSLLTTGTALRVQRGFVELARKKLRLPH